MMAMKGFRSVAPNGRVPRHRIKNCKLVDDELPYLEIPEDAERCDDCYAGNFVLYAIEWARRQGRNCRQLR